MIGEDTRRLLQQEVVEVSPSWGALASMQSTFDGKFSFLS